MKEDQINLFAIAADLFRRKKIKEAMKAFDIFFSLKEARSAKTKENAFRIEKIDSSACIEEAQNLFEEKKYKQAASKYEQAIKLGITKPITRADTHWNLALCYQENAQFAEAQVKAECLHDAIKQVSLARAFYSTSKPAEVAACDELILTLTKTLSDGLLALDELQEAKILKNMFSKLAEEVQNVLDEEMEEEKHEPAEIGQKSQRQIKFYHNFKKPSLAAKSTVQQHLISAKERYPLHCRLKDNAEQLPFKKRYYCG